MGLGGSDMVRSSAIFMCGTSTDMTSAGKIGAEKSMHITMLAAA